MSAPIFSSIKYEYNFVTINFDQGVYNTNGGSGALETSDFTCTYTDNSDTGSSAATIVAISKIDNTILTGGETSLRLHLNTTGVPIGAKCTIHAASAKTDTLLITGSILPIIIKINLTTNSSDNLIVEQDISTYDYILNIKLANTTASKNTATLIQAAIRALETIGSVRYGGLINLSTVTCTAGGNWDTAAIATGESNLLLLGGLATFEITAASNSIYNTGGEVMSTSQTTGIYNLNPFKYIYVAKNGLDTNSGLIATLPKLNFSAGKGLEVTGENYLIFGIGDYTENIGFDTSNKYWNVIGDQSDYITYSNSGVAGICRYYCGGVGARSLRLSLNYTWKINNSTGGWQYENSNTPKRLINIIFEIAGDSNIWYCGVDTDRFPYYYMNCSSKNLGNYACGLKYCNFGYYYGTEYFTDCDFYTNYTYAGMKNTTPIDTKNCKFRFDLNDLNNVLGSTQIKFDTTTWSTGHKFNNDYNTYMTYKPKWDPLIWNNLTNVSTTQDFYNFFNSTTAVAYPTDTYTPYASFKQNNLKMYVAQEKNKIYINGINSDEISYEMTPTGIYKSTTTTHNSAPETTYYCSKVNTTGIYREWIKLNNILDSTAYKLTFDFLRYFTTSTAKHIYIEIVKGQSLAESTPVAQFDLLASSYTDNTYYDANVLNFTTLADNDDYWLSIKFCTAVGTNNLFKFTSHGISLQ